PATAEPTWRLAALAWLLHERTEAAQLSDPHSPWDLRDGWRLGEPAPRSLILQQGDARRTLRASATDAGWRIHDNATDAVLLATGSLQDGRLLAQLDVHRVHADAVFAGSRLHLFVAGQAHLFDLHDPVAEADQPIAEAGGLTAPMPGRVVALLVAPGTRVARGTPLLVLEAMKMEHTLQAPTDGVVHGYRVREGELVGDGVALLEFEED
ncbi:acetyl-CoA carboxylase biotin carboxyl carrier protein subunit, partial [Xanthomonas translucens]|uniref:acetyl-CoA carboxylase biotin carboxyl carrier protein subunit n=2 Tax=Xanthomonas campestris pv. translucens TaxID=343 RepID=UPI00272E64D7